MSPCEEDVCIYQQLKPKIAEELELNWVGEAQSALNLSLEVC